MCGTMVRAIDGGGNDTGTQWNTYWVWQAVCVANSALCVGTCGSMLTHTHCPNWGIGLVRKSQKCGRVCDVYVDIVGNIHTGLHWNIVGGALVQVEKMAVQFGVVGSILVVMVYV